MTRLGLPPILHVDAFDPPDPHLMVVSAYAAALHASGLTPQEALRAAAKAFPRPTQPPREPQGPQEEPAGWDAVLHPPQAATAPPVTPPRHSSTRPARSRTGMEHATTYAGWFTIAALAGTVAATRVLP